MDGGMHEPLLGLDEVSAGRLMPMYLCVSPTGHIRKVGPTLTKILGRDGLIGRRFLEVFTLRRPHSVLSTADLMGVSGAQLSLSLREAPHTQFKGIAVLLEGAAGLLFNLSFGISVADAVRTHQLSYADFAPTDLVVEMLFLTEAKTAVMDELKRLNQRLHQAKIAAEDQALTDAVTGLRNRRAMERVLRRILEMRAPFSLMGMDLDYFKQVNDSLGHAAGDFVLDRVGKILTAETRQSDTVARVGGDEFVLIFPGLVQDEKLSSLAHRILARIEEPMAFEGNPCRISASIGTITVAPDDSSAAQVLLANVDRALYRSKQLGRGRVTPFDPTIGAAPAD